MALALLAVAAFTAALPQTASAQTNNCLQDLYGKNVQCTANDVRIASASNVRNLDGTSKTSCIAGSTFSFVADFLVVTTATARENIGLYFGTGGQGNALKGTCGDNIISPLHTAANPNDKVQLGTSQYQENDASPDTCGDITTADNNQVITVEVDNALCQAAPGTNQVALPNCTSWQQPGGTQLCVSNAPNWPFPAAPAANPGSPSKCNCDNTFTIPVTVQNPMASIVKSCNTGSGASTSSCTLSPEGGSVTYTATISNSSNFGDIIIDQLCDSAYGNLFTASGFSACPAGSQTGVSITNNTCAALDIAASSQGSCNFTVNQAENISVPNIITMKGHGSSAGTFGPTTSNQVTVTSNEAPTTGTITKTYAATTAGCATVRYNVDVKDTSASGTDETLTLSGLTDDAVDITKLSTSVLGTTCGVANGLGTLSNSAGAGVLPATIAVGGGEYKCQVDVQFCAGISTITLPNNTTCSGIQHTDTLSATTAGDEKENISLTPGTLTVSECFAPSAQ